MHRCEDFHLMVYLFRYLKTFQYILKRLQFTRKEEKGILFSFSTSVEKDIFWLLQQNNAVIAYMSKFIRRKTK